MSRIVPCRNAQQRFVHCFSAKRDKILLVLCNVELSTVVLFYVSLSFVACAGHPNRWSVQSSVVYSTVAYCRVRYLCAR
jgi:hypothetical protein